MEHGNLRMEDIAPKFVSTSDEAIRQAGGFFPSQFLAELCLVAQQVERTRIENAVRLGRRNAQDRAARLAAMMALYAPAP